ncbi:MAG: hypothetical protein KKF44_02605 [Nanoarchaeota archaeon]|nr:hypothetical protein [Nanoarchaeota archaeon]
MKPKLYFLLCADTEDNHPNYIAGWEKVGSNYDEKQPIFRYDWTKYWDKLTAVFDRFDLKLPWFARTDMCILDDFLKKAKKQLKSLMENDHLIGIHIHTLYWDGKIWRQDVNEMNQKKIIKNSVRIFKDTMGFHPAVSRMGWNAMTNSIMIALEKENIRIDMSCVPGYHSAGMYGERDNIIDWQDSASNTYHPSGTDYKNKGNMKILEIPISVARGKKNMIFNAGMLNKIINRYLHRPVSKIIRKSGKMIDYIGYSPHSAFTISPFWSNRNIIKLIHQKKDEAKKNGKALLIGYFHPCDIFDAKKQGLNQRYISGMTDILSEIYSSDVEILDSRKIYEIKEGE